MSFFGKRPKTAQQKAQMAKTRIMLRAVALGFLVFYVIIPMIDPDIEDVEGMHPMLRYGILAFFIIACLGLAILTIQEFVRSRKAGLYDAAAYKDDEGIEGAPDVESESDSEDDNDDIKDDDNDDDDEYCDGNCDECENPCDDDDDDDNDDNDGKSESV